MQSNSPIGSDAATPPFFAHALDSDSFTLSTATLATHRGSADSAVDTSVDEYGEDKMGDDDNNMPEAIRRRRAHLASEKKRRNNLKDAFEEIKTMIPQCRNFPHSKNSKEAVLRKACDYIRYLHIQRAQMTEEIKHLRNTVNQHGIQVPVQSSHTAQSTNAASQPVDIDGSMESAFPPGAKTLVLLALVDAIYEAFMNHVSVRSPEEFSVTLLTFFQQHCTPEKLHATVLRSLQTMVANFSPITDGSSCRIRKWLDALNWCNVSAFDENVSTRVRGILSSVLTNFLPFASR